MVLFKSNYINKAVSSVLLVLLLFIHSIKLLHTHSNSFFSNHNCNGLDGKKTYEFATSSSDCSICSYQLGKDADDLVYPEFCDPSPAQIDFNTRLISFHKFSLPSTFENRGPPTIIQYFLKKLSFKEITTCYLRFYFIKDCQFILKAVTCQNQFYIFRYFVFCR